MRRVWVIGLILFSSLALADEEETPKPAPPDDSTVLATRKGLTFHANAGIDVHRWVDSGSDARVVPAVGFTADYFLGDVFGFYASLDHVNRGYKAAGGSMTATFIDFGIGAALRYRGNLFSSSSVNYLQVGALFAVPTGDFSGSLALATSSSKLFIGLHMQGSSAYPLGNGLALGPVTWIKFGFGNPVSGLVASRWFTHVGLGAQLTF